MRRSLRKSVGNGTPYSRRSIGDQSIMVARKRKSLRLQHSISLHIPMEELDPTACHMNCYVDLGRQVFSLTYLEVNDTQNPESLQALEELRKKNWQVYLVGTLFNFGYTNLQMRALSRALKRAFSSEFQNCHGNLDFHAEISSVEGFNPTENDNQALNIKVWVSEDIGDENDQIKLLYDGYLISWCLPEKSNKVLLPTLFCSGKKKYQTLVNTILSEKLDTKIQRMVLTQEEFLHLTTYCLIMLDENDDFPLRMSFEINVGTIYIDVSVKSLLKLWKNIHKDETIEVELDEVILFNEAFENFVESAMGMTLAHTLFQSMKVKGNFFLQRNGQMQLFSTKTIHVVLKYLNCLSVQRLKIKAQNSD